MDYDVLIAGAGPAGSMTAWKLAERDIKVLMVDKKREIGVPVRCAEYIPALLSKEIPIPPGAIASEIKKMRVYFDNTSYEFSTPGYILNRSLFEKFLVTKAIKAGCTLWLNTEFIGFKDNRPIVLKDGKEVEVGAKIIVGADGPASRLGRLINGRYQEYVVAYQQELPIINRMDYTEVYFDKKFYGGYAWVFPKQSSANVGVGVKVSLERGIIIKEVYNYFVENLIKDNKILPSPLKTITGIIPVAGPAKTVKGNILLVGDAAGQTHPITGAGIPQAIICAKSAAEAIIKALKKNNLNHLIEYEKEWQDLYGKELTRAIIKRRKMEAEWDNLEKIFKECWLSFAEYYG